MEKHVLCRHLITFIRLKTNSTLTTAHINRIQRATFVMGLILKIYPMRFAMSVSTSEIVPILNFSTRTLSMSGVKNAGSVGPL